MKTKYRSIEEMNDRIVHDLEKDARWEQEQADLADDILKVIGAVALAGIGFLAGFHVGMLRADAATLTRAHLRTAPYYTAGTLMVEPVPESTAEGQPPEAIEADAEVMPPDAVMVEAVGERWESAGTWLLTAYCPGSCCNGSNAHRTASGASMVVGRTVAVGHLPFGTEIMINGHVYTVEDRGVHGHHVDILFPTHSEANHFGMQHAEVFIKKQEP